MSKLNPDQWSAMWTEDTVTTLPSMFEDNYDLSIADFWHKVLDRKCGQVIDLACGNGALTWLVNDFLNKEGGNTAITGIDVANIDPFKALGKEKTEFPMVRFVGNTAIEELPLDDNSADIAISQYGLEYSDLQRSIPEIGRVLKPEARLGLILHNEQSFILNGSTESLKRHKRVLEEVKMHELFIQLDRLIGKSRDLSKCMSKPKVQKKMNAINEASLKIKNIMNTDTLNKTFTVLKAQD